MDNVNNKKDWKKEIVSYLLLVLGSALFAVGDVMFVNPYHLAPGGAVPVDEKGFLQGIHTE